VVALAPGPDVNHDELVGYCLGKPGAEQDMPWDGDIVAKVGGKIFAFLGGNGAQLGGPARSAAVNRSTLTSSRRTAIPVGCAEWRIPRAP
jgi:hypothetical protein